jgi:hypothetical protein
MPPCAFILAEGDPRYHDGRKGYCSAKGMRNAE